MRQESAHRGCGKAGGQDMCKDTTENSDSVYAFAVRALKSITSRKEKGNSPPQICEMWRPFTQKETIV